MERYLVHVQVEGPTDDVTEQTVTLTLRDYGFTRFLTLDNGNVAPLGPWLYGGEAEDPDNLAHLLCKSFTTLVNARWLCWSHRPQRPMAFIPRAQ